MHTDICHANGPGGHIGGTPSAKFGTSLTFAPDVGSSSNSVSAKNSSKSAHEQTETKPAY